MDDFDFDPDLAKGIREKFGISSNTLKKRADCLVQSKKSKEDLQKLLELIKQLREEESSC